MQLKPLASNMTELKLSNGTTVLFSYETPVATFEYAFGGKKTAKKWSQTTSKHINKWFNTMGYNAKDMPALEQGYFDNLIK